MADTRVTIVDVDDVVPVAQGPARTEQTRIAIGAQEHGTSGKITSFSADHRGKQGEVQQKKTGPTPFPYASDERIAGDDPDLKFDPRVAEREGEDAEKDGRSSVFSAKMRQNRAYLQFKDLKYEVDVTVKKEKKTRTIIKGLTGDCKPGRVLAIMGASGAGKTTLLNILAGRLSQAGNGRTSGSVLVNGHKRDYTVFRKQSAYVLQQDVFYAELTVRETITLSALLRLPQSMSREDKLSRVEEVIAELGLNKCADTVVGNDLLRGISGGEKKRCNIGTELVVDPSLVFLDEPTTGLDAFNAQNVMTTLLALAKSGRTVVCTIHQPRSEIYGLLDELMLLSEGYMMYFGTAKDAPSYFARLGYECPESYNPSDYFLDLISLDARSKTREECTKKRIQFLAESYADYREEHPLEELNAEEFMSSRSIAKLHGEARSESEYATTWITQFGLLFRRAAKILFREKATNMARIMQTLVFSILLGLIWLNEGGDASGQSVQSVAGAIFFILINQSFSGVFQIIFVFPVERSIVLKERASRSYHVGAYFWSKTISELPRTFMVNLIFSIIGYNMIHFRPGAEYFFKFLLAVFFVTLASESIAYCVSALARDPQQAGALAPVFVITSILFGGFFIGVDAIPVWLSWLRYLSYLKYGFAAVMQVEFEGRSLDTSACAPNTQFCPPNGDAVLNFYELDELPYWANIGILIALAAGIRVFAYIFLRRNGPKYDKSI